MELARVIRTCALPMTNQALADLAFQADLERRAALRRGDKALAAELDQEVKDLTAQMR